MGRANPNRGGPTSARSSASSLASTSSALPLITSELDPAHPINLKRSLSRNDVELAALEKLHSQIRLIKGAIVKEFGEERLLECVLNEKKKWKGDVTIDNIDTIETDDNGNDDDNDNSGSSNDKRLNLLTTSFFLRMKLLWRIVGGEFITEFICLGILMKYS